MFQLIGRSIETDSEMPVDHFEDRNIDRAYDIPT